MATIPVSERLVEYSNRNSDLKWTSTSRDSSIAARPGCRLELRWGWLVGGFGTGGRVWVSSIHNWRAFSPEMARRLADWRLAVHEVWSDSIDRCAGRPQTADPVRWLGPGARGWLLMKKRGFRERCLGRGKKDTAQPEQYVVGNGWLYGSKSTAH